MFSLRAPYVVAQPRRRDVVVRVGTTLYSSDKELQLTLIWLGYDIGPSGADGSIGPKTKAAIIDFKKTHGLAPADSTITYELMTALNAEIAARSAPAPKPAPDAPAPMPAPADVPAPKPAPAAGGIGRGIIVAGVLAVVVLGVGIYAFAS